MAMSRGKLMLSLALDKQTPSYMDIDEKTWPAEKLKKFNAEQLSSSDDDEDLYKPLLNNDHAGTQDNVAISEVSSREYRDNAG